jgi:hypothetical protein
VHDAVTDGEEWATRELFLDGIDQKLESRLVVREQN